MRSENAPDATAVLALRPSFIDFSTNAKIDAAVTRLRARAEVEGGPAALEVFAPAGGSNTGPDAEALLAAIPAILAPTAPGSSGARSRTAARTLAARLPGLAESISTPLIRRPCLRSS